VTRYPYAIPLIAALGAVALAPLAPRQATLEAQSHVLIVSGLGGAPQYRAEFKQLGTALATAARQKYGLPDSEVVYLAEDGAGPGVTGRSTREEIERALGSFRARAGANDQLVLVLIGHGSGDGAESKVSLPGPDMTASDFAKLLSGWSSQRVAFVNLTSASGDFLPIVSGANRVVITATKSSFERNESVFAKHFVAALTADGADTDKDGRVSLLEAYRYAAAETKRHYDQESTLQTEHAQLDDDGDGKGTAEPTARQGDGLLAQRFFLAGAAGGLAQAGAAGDARLAALYRDKADLEERIDAVKRKKGTMAENAYYDELEELLVQLARRSVEIRRLEGRAQ
jgi:hypothetical protein